MQKITKMSFFHFKYFIDKSIGLDNTLCLYKSSPTTRWNNLNTIYIRHREIYPSCIHAIHLITKHKHMYINSRIIQTKQKRFFPFFPFFVNRYDIIRILKAESYKTSVFPFFSIKYMYIDTS